MTKSFIILHKVESIVDHLCNNMVGDKEQLRDISSIGLKTVINELPLTTQTLAASVCKTMTGRWACLPRLGLHQY